MTRTKLSIVAGFFAVAALMLVARPNSTSAAEAAGWKWVNRNGDCVDTCSRDDCPCYSWIE